MTIENRLWELMAIHSEKIKDLMNATGISRNAISNIKNNKRANINLPTLEILCSHYGIMPGEFFKVQSESKKSN